MMLYLAAFSVAAIDIFVPHLWLGWCFLVALFVPAMAIYCLFPDSLRWGPLFAPGFYVLYISRRMKQVCAGYQEKLAEKRHLEATASRDPLSVARERKRPVALLFLDLDGFKAVNDTLSHRAGDLLLCGIANRLSGYAGSAHKVARFGATNFLSFLPRRFSRPRVTGFSVSPKRSAPQCAAPSRLKTVSAGWASASGSVFSRMTRTEART
jgi:GGDEF domain-containing protein